MKRREKVFGPGRAVPLDRNAKIRIAACTRAWSARNRRPGQHHGPITMAFERVLQALLWSFHNSRDGRCFPSYERIATQARCCRSTVAEALKALEWAGVLSWQHRVTRARESVTDLFGAASWRWRVVRMSNCYQFTDPKAAERRGVPSESENPAGTQNQVTLGSVPRPRLDSTLPLESALAGLGAAISAKNGIERGVSTADGSLTAMAKRIPIHLYARKYAPAEVRERIDVLVAQAEAEWFRANPIGLKVTETVKGREVVRYEPPGLDELCRAIIRERRPKAWIRNPFTDGWIPFDALREGINWLDGKCGKQPVEVEDEGAPRLSNAERDKIAREFIAARPSAGMREAWELYHEQHPDRADPLYISRKVFEALGAGGAGNKRARSRAQTKARKPKS